jgi:hypothetical protein
MAFNQSEYSQHFLCGQGEDSLFELFRQTLLFLFVINQKVSGREAFLSWEAFPSWETFASWEAFTSWDVFSTWKAGLVGKKLLNEIMIFVVITTRIVSFCIST